MKTETTESRRARFLHQESREYRGLRHVQDYKTRASRAERRAAKQRLSVAKSLVQCSNTN